MGSQHDHTDLIFPPLLNRIHRVMISVRVGQSSQRAAYLASICIHKSSAIKGKLNAPKPDQKTPKTQQVVKNGEVYPNQSSGATLGVEGDPIETNK